MKKSILLAGALVAMASCSTNEVYDINPSNPDVITFGTYVSQTTRGTVLNQTALQSDNGNFGMMAYQTYQEEWGDDATFIPNFMYNQKVTYSDANGSWSYSPLKYWPNTEGDKLSFFTYAPYPSETNGIAPVTTNTTQGLPKIGFTLNSDPSKMVDFVAGQNMDMVRQQERVMFNLKHQLTRVTFSAIATPDNTTSEFGGTAAGDGESHVVVKSIDVVGGADSKFFTKGIYTHNMITTNSSKTDHAQDGTWVVSDPIASNYSLGTVLATTDVVVGEYSAKGIDLVIGATDYTSLFTSGEYLFLLPPNGAEGLGAESISLKIAYDVITIDDAVESKYTQSEAVYTVTLPAGTLKQGKAYNFQLKFNASEITVNANVVDWDESEIENDDTDVHPFDEESEEGGENGEGEPEITGFDYTQYAVGDYVDDKGNIVADKSSAIGMVTAVGEDYAVLASLTRVSNTNWMNDPIYDVDYQFTYTDGYGNTEALKEISAIAKSCWDKGEVEAFKSTKDATKGQWYMPAFNELKQVLTADNLVQLYGADWQNDYTGFWSSSEANELTAVGCYSSNITSYDYVDKAQATPWCTIPIIRF